MGVEGDTLDVFFVRGYYRELGYIEVENCWWKDPGVSLSSELRRLVTNRDLVIMCKGCRRNHNLINIYLENYISQPCIVDILEKEVVNVKAESLKQRKPMEANKCSSQPVKKPTAMVPGSKKQTSNPNKTTLQLKSRPNKPTMKAIFEPNKSTMKPNSEPTKPVHQPRKTTSQPMKPVPQAKKTSHQAKSVPPQSNASSQGDKDSSSGCRVTRSGRQVKEAPFHEDDSNSHDSYESTEDEPYRSPKVVGDNLYSSDSDSDSDSKKSNGKGDSRSEVRHKHKPPKQSQHGTPLTSYTTLTRYLGHARNSLSGFSAVSDFLIAAFNPQKHDSSWIFFLVQIEAVEPLLPFDGNDTPPRPPFAASIVAPNQQFQHLRRHRALF